MKVVKILLRLMAIVTMIFAIYENIYVVIDSYKYRKWLKEIGVEDW